MTAFWSVPDLNTQQADGLHTWLGCDPRLTPRGALDGPALAKQAQMCNRGYLYQRVVRLPAPEMSVSA